ncbi:MAG: spore coat associated protein CotJA [Firmicutes bacterium]|nr:spore coat associated protein CotJA [Bacillota bacterium]
MIAMHKNNCRCPQEIRSGVSREREDDCKCGRVHDCGEREMPDCCLCDGQPISLAMAYVKNQKYECLYSPAEALCRGTLFSALDLPLCENGGTR